MDEHNRLNLEIFSREYWSKLAQWQSLSSIFDRLRMPSGASLQLRLTL